MADGFQDGLDAFNKKDFKTAYQIFFRLAKEGDVEAQFSLGMMHSKGMGVPQDDKQATRWCRLAAEQEKKNAELKKKNQIASAKRSASNPGFRDLRPGIHHSTIVNKNLCKDTTIYAFTTCYDLQNLKFRGTFDINGSLDKLTVDLGPIVGSVGIIDELATYLQKGETNIYLKMRNILGEKYKMDFEYSERDRQLFNKDEKDKLYTVYKMGQVALLITRKEKKYSHDLWLYIEYRDVEPAELFFKSEKPKRAKKSDF